MLQQLQISACTENGGQDKSKTVTLQVNPTSINLTGQNQYSEEDVIGATGSDQKFKKTEPGTFSIKTMLDSTGVIKPVLTDVTEKINEIKNVCYTYHGNKHEPNKVIILWGNILFKGCLTKLNIKYDLFDGEGKLLCAELEMDFLQYKEKKEEIKEKNQESPDITHIKILKAGDSLPAMCREIYKNTKLFYEIARINNITDFRNIKTGTKLVFPSIK